MIKSRNLGVVNALISVAEPKPVDTLIKTGIHINWPGFVVNEIIRISSKRTCYKYFKFRRGSRDWKDIIDISVCRNSSRNTKGSGFRMPWSHKRGKHEACAGQGCELCNNTGKETQSEYLLIFIYKHFLSILQKTEQKPSLDMLHMATLRTESTNPVIIEGSSSKNEGNNFTKIQTKNEFKNQEALLLVEAFVRKNIEGQGAASITKMFKHKNQFLVSTNSKYCENKKCNHNSNHVWFHIIGDTISQKCFSTTNILRQYGFCKDFSGRRHQLTKKITDIIYEDGKVEKYTPKKKVVTSPNQNQIYLKNL